VVDNYYSLCLRLSLVHTAQISSDSLFYDAAQRLSESALQQQYIHTTLSFYSSASWLRARRIARSE